MESVLKDNDTRLVVVEGAPGIGKSTLAWELCRRWPTLKSLNRFSLVVLLRLREEGVQTATAISDLFPCLDDPDLGRCVGEEVRKRMGEGVLLVFDGFDEFPSELRRKSLVAQVISGSYLLKATVLVTSRPSATAELLSVCQAHVGKHIEVVGFSYKEIQEYAESVFGSEPELLASFQTYLSVNPVVRGMMYNPLNCGMVVEVYRNSSLSDRPIPHTQTQLYTELSLCLLSRHLSAAGDLLARRLPDRLEDLPHDSDLYKQLVRVGRLAFEGRVREEVIFKELPEGCSALGLLNTCSELYGRRENVTYNFLHLTLQEYLGAFCISQLPASEQRKLFVEHSELGHLNVVWRFVAGLTRMKAIGWEEFRGRNVEVEGRVYGDSGYEVEDGVVKVWPSLVQCLYEARDAGSCGSVLGQSRVEYRGKGCSTHFDAYAVGYCVSLCRNEWNVDLSENGLGPEVVEMLMCGLKFAQYGGGSLEKLCLSSNSITDEGIKYLQQFPAQILQQMKTLEVRACGLRKREFTLLAGALPHLSNLNLLDISYNVGGNSSTVKLLRAAGKHPTVEHLRMHSTGIGRADVEALCGAFQPSGSLRHLTIGRDTDLSPECVQQVVRKMLSLPLLRALWMWVPTSVSPLDCIETISDKLSELGFWATSISSEQLPTELNCSKFINILEENTTLKHLEITIPLEKVEVKAIVESLKHNHTLSVLKLSERYHSQYFSKSEQKALDHRIEWKWWRDDPPDSERDIFTQELQQQLQKGYILADYTICAVSGAPGVGKTSLGHFLCNETLPHARTSTACMEQAKRFIIEVKDGQSRRCRLISTSDMVDMIAENLSAGVFITEKESDTSAAPVTSQHTESSSDQSQAKPQEPLKEEKKAVSKAEVEQPPDEDIEREPVGSEKGANVPITSPIGNTSSAVSWVKVLPRTAEIVKKITKMKGSGEVLKTHFLLFVDCGGQPQFLETISILLKNAFLQLLLFKLSDKLDDHPAVDYYAANGANYSLGHFTLTNAELLMRCMQMTQSQHSQLPMSFIEKQPEHPKNIVIGTFKDKLHASGEPLEDKNRKLATMLERFKKYLITYSHNEIIHAIDNTRSGPGVPRDPMAENLLQMIERCGQSIRLKYPVGYYLLEVELRRAGRIVSRAECWAIAQQLMFESEESMEVALQFFHAINLMFYFPAVVKETIFVDPMALLDLITCVFEKSIEVMDAPEGDVQSEEMIRLRNQALITSSFLQSLQSEITSGLAVNTLIKVLEHLLIIAPVQSENDTKYFMPSLLDSRESNEIVRPSDGAAATLKIRFSSEHVPSGVLCCLVVYMRSSRGIFQWQIPPHHSEEPTRLYKNELYFTLAKYDGGITLIDDDTHYSLYVDGYCPTELLPLIWNDISHGISDVCKELSLSVKHEMGFDCLCDKLSPHLAVVSSDHKSWECSEDACVTGTLTDKQKLWLPVQENLKTEFFHHKFDSAYPGICFLGDPWKEIITSKGGSVSWKMIGIYIDIPPGAVPKGKSLELKVRPCLSGPFFPPKGYRLASPVYLITPAFDFLKEVKLSIAHYAALDSNNDCASMTFISSSSSPKYAPHARYEFKALSGGLFQKKKHGVIFLKHFCHEAIAQQTSQSGATASQQEAKNDYSIQLYQSELQVAIFSVSLCHPVYTENLKKQLEEKYRGIKFDVDTEEPISIVDSKVVLKIPEKTEDWEIIPSKLPAAILQRQVDLPQHIPSLESSSTYPPCIRLHVSLTKPHAREYFCFLEVKGIDQELKLMLKIISHSESKPHEKFGHKSLKMSPLKDIINALHKAGFADAEWELLGMQLNVPQTQLDNIRANRNDVQRQLMDVITQWMKRDTNASWEDLADALDKIEKYGPATAKNFRQAAGIPPGDESEKEVPPPSEEIADGGKKDFQKTLRKRSKAESHQGVGQEESTKVQCPSSPNMEGTVERTCFMKLLLLFIPFAIFCLVIFVVCFCYFWFLL